MSIYLMSKSWKLNISSTQKFVLIALCDCANDVGECYPSVTNIAIKTSLSKRTVQSAIHELEELGFLRRDFRTGRSTVYWVTIKENNEEPAQISHPRKSRTRANDSWGYANTAPPPAQISHDTRATDAPRNIIETSIEPLHNLKEKKPSKKTDDELVLEKFEITGQLAKDFIKHRKAKKASITETALARLKAQAEKAGISLKEAIEICIEKNWQGFNSEWIATPEAKKEPSRHKAVW